MNSDEYATEIKRTPEEIDERIEVLRRDRDQERELGNEEAADQREAAIMALKWVKGDEIPLEERGQ